MPVHRQKKDTTPNTHVSTQEQTAPPLPDQQAFHQHVRELARGAIRVVLEEVVREELDALIGVGWGESNPKRKGYRKGRPIILQHTSVTGRQDQPLFLSLPCLYSCYSLLLFKNGYAKLSRRPARYHLAMTLFQPPLSERSVTVTVSLRSPVVTPVAQRRQVTSAPLWLSAFRVPRGC